MGRPPKVKQNATLQPSQPGQMPVPVVVEPTRRKQPPPVYEYAPIRTLGEGESPGDILLAEARFYFDQVQRERAKRRPSKAVLADLWARAREASKAAAPYCHTKLASLKFSGDMHTTNTWNINLLMAAVAKLPDGELENFERLFRLIAAAAESAEPGAGGHPAGSHATGG